MNNNQRGKVRIGTYFLETNPEEVLALFFQLKLLVIRAEYYYDNQTIEYTCISPNFQEVSPNIATPDYQIIARQQKIDEEHIEIYYRMEKVNNATGWAEPFTTIKVP